MGSIDLMNPAKLNTPSSGNSKIDQFAKQQQAQKAKDAVQDATDTLAKTLDDIKMVHIILTHPIFMLIILVALLPRKQLTMLQKQPRMLQKM